MVIYLVCFLLSVVFILLGERTENRLTRTFFFIIGLLIPCLLAGLRADSVGTDTSYYPHSLFANARESRNIIDYYNSTIYYSWKTTHVYQLEYGYTFLVYISQRTFNNIAVLLFLSECLTIIPIFIALKRIQNYYGDFPAWLGMLVFYFLDFNVTLNAMRQWIAMAFLLFGSTYLLSRRDKRYIVSLIVAFLFHQAAIIGILIYFIYKIYSFRYSIVCGSLRVSYKLVSIFIVFVVSSIFIWWMNTFLYSLTNAIGMARYSAYLNGKISFSLNQFIIRLPILILLVIEAKNYWRVEYDNTTLKNYKMLILSMFLLELVVSQLASISENSWRISLYFGCFDIILIPLLYSSDSNQSNRKFLMLFIIIYLASYWFYFFAIIGSHGTVPYVFRKF